MANFNKAINEYYKLKQKYEEQIKKKTDIIKKNTELTKREKHLLYTEQKKKCILCKKDGGTIFEDKNNILSAVCGSKSRCKLDIKIQRTKYTNLMKDVEFLGSIILESRKNIIKNKLNFLFAYENQETSLSNFNTQRTDLIRDLKKFETLYNSLTEITDNKSIKSENESLLLTISQFKKLINNFKIGGEEVNIKEAIDLYLNNILILVKQIQDIKYKYNSVFFNENENTYHLIQEVFTPEELQIPENPDNNKVISFTT